MALVLLGVVLSTALFVFLRGINSSSTITLKGEKLVEFSNLYWDLTRAFYGAKELALINGTQLYLITTGGLFYPGVVHSAFIYRNGTLYYYEYPYPYGDIRHVEEDRLIALYRLDSFRMEVIDKGGKPSLNYRGKKPYMMEVNASGEVFYLKF